MSLIKAAAISLGLLVGSLFAKEQKKDFGLGVGVYHNGETKANFMPITSSLNLDMGKIGIGAKAGSDLISKVSYGIDGKDYMVGLNVDWFPFISGKNNKFSKKGFGIEGVISHIDLTHSQKIESFDLNTGDKLESKTIKKNNKEDAKLLSVYLVAETDRSKKHDEFNKPTVRLEHRFKIGYSFGIIDRKLNVDWLTYSKFNHVMLSYELLIFTHRNDKPKSAKFAKPPKKKKNNTSINLLFGSQDDMACYLFDISWEKLSLDVNIIPDKTGFIMGGAVYPNTKKLRIPFVKIPLGLGYETGFGEYYDRNFTHLALKYSGLRLKLGSDNKEFKAAFTATNGFKLNDDLRLFFAIRNFVLPGAMLRYTSGNQAYSIHAFKKGDDALVGAEIFPHTSIFRNQHIGAGLDVVMSRGKVIEYIPNITASKRTGILKAGVKIDENKNYEPYIGLTLYGRMIESKKKKVTDEDRYKRKK